MYRICNFKTLVLAKTINPSLTQRLLGTVKYSPAIDHYKVFAGIVGESYVKKDPFDLEKYQRDWKRNFFGGSLVICPKTTQEVSAIVKYCNKHKIGVVVQSGNTGLVGGQVGYDHDDVKYHELILSMERMNAIQGFDSVGSTVTCEAGIVLEKLQTAADELGYLVPLDLGPKGSCMIGGNIATNAGGLRVVKYGSLQSNVLGLEVVLPSGEVCDMLRTLNKDNTGYHLRHLFIGSEGTLGVITKISMKLAVKPKSSAVLFTKVPSFASVPTILQTARQVLGPNLSAFEFMDGPSLYAVRSAAPHLIQRVAEEVLPKTSFATMTSEEKSNNSTEEAQGLGGEMAVLIEATGTDPDTDSVRLERFVEALTDQQLVTEAVMSSDRKKELELWSVREHVPVCLIDYSRAHLVSHPDPKHNVLLERGYARDAKKAVVSLGYMYKYDLSLPLAQIPNVLYETKLALQREGFHIVGFQPIDTTNTNTNTNTAASTTSDTDSNGKVSSTLYPQCSMEFCNYGHAGDQNLHLNIHVRVVGVVDKQFVDKIAQTRNLSTDLLNAASVVAFDASKPCPDVAFTDFVHHVHDVIDHHLYAAVLRRRGSVSAEHGIGQEKKVALQLARHGPELMLMKQIKQIVDPNNIMNPESSGITIINENSGATQNNSNFV